MPRRETFKHRTGRSDGSGAPRRLCRADKSRGDALASAHAGPDRDGGPNPDSDPDTHSDSDTRTDD